MSEDDVTTAGWVKSILLLTGFPGRCPTARRPCGGWCGRSRRSRASLSLQLVGIALYLCDPRPNKLKGVICGPVSQTRVCEPPSQGESFADSSTRTAPKLARCWSEDRPAQVSPPGASWQDSTVTLFTSSNYLAARNNLPPPFHLPRATGATSSPEKAGKKRQPSNGRSNVALSFERTQPTSPGP